MGEVKSQGCSNLPCLGAETDGVACKMDQQTVGIHLFSAAFEGPFPAQFMDGLRDFFLDLLAGFRVGI
jgi:hypothetical protein